MTMTLADIAPVDDRGMAPRADQPKRRRFTAEYKAEIMAEYDAADRGERGAILRREGLGNSPIPHGARRLITERRPNVPPSARS